MHNMSEKDTMLMSEKMSVLENAPLVRSLNLVQQTMSDMVQRDVTDAVNIPAAVPCTSNEQESCEHDTKKDLEKAASSPDSAIDLSEDSKHLPGPDFPLQILGSEEMGAPDIVAELIDSVLNEVCSSEKKRQRRKKREKFSISEKWELMKECGVVGWKRILARNTDEEGGWGFNFISPNGVRLNSKELEKFLRKKRLTMDDLIFQAKADEKISFPRKQAKLKVRYPRFKIKDMKRSRKEDIERRKKLQQARIADKPQFKSVSEFLASLDRCDSQSSSCSDISRLNEESDSEEYEESDTSFLDMQEDENFTFCSEIVDDCFDKAFDLSALDDQFSHNDSKIKLLEQNIEQVKMSISGMLKGKESQSPQTVEKLKIKLSEVPNKKVDKLKIKISDTALERPIEKLKITPERLKGFYSKSLQHSASPKKLKIKLPNDTPERIKLTIKTPKSGEKGLEKHRKKHRSQEHKILSNIKIKPLVKPAEEDSKNKTDVLEDMAKSKSESKLKKYSIFKTRNTNNPSETSEVSFTDINAKKSLSIRKVNDSDSENENKVLSRPSNENLKIEINDDDLDSQNLNDEFATAVQLESPHSKVTVVEQTDTTTATPVRRNIFGPHSPMCKDEISPEKSDSPQPLVDCIEEGGNKEVVISDCVKTVTVPAPRTHGRVISTEDAIKAIDAVVDPDQIPVKEEIENAATENIPLLKESPVYKSCDISPLAPERLPTPVVPVPTPTPSLPMLSPHEDCTHSNMTTPSLPSLSPAIPRHTNFAPSGGNSGHTSLCNSPSLPIVSPVILSTEKVGKSLPKRPEGILPRRLQTMKTIQDFDPAISTPLSVEIPSSSEERVNHLSNSSQSFQPSATDKDITSSKNVNQVSTVSENDGTTAITNNLEDDAEKIDDTHFLSKKQNMAESPEVSQTGRRMRDCRKFIHYEFSPPFASSESSVSEVEDDDISIKRLTKKKGKYKGKSNISTFPETENVETENSISKPKKRGRPVKSKSTDEFLSFDEGSNASEENVIGSEKLKKKRGRPPKIRHTSKDSDMLSVSEMAEHLAENHLSPITREKLSLPSTSNQNYQKNKKVAALQRQSLLQRRNSEDHPRPKPCSKVERSKSTDVTDEGISDKFEGLEDLKKRLTESLAHIPANKLLLQSVVEPQEDALLQKERPKDGLCEEEENTKTKPFSESQESSSYVNPDTLYEGETQIIRKKVRVQDYSEPLMKIVDQLPKNSPPPQMINTDGILEPPPPGSSTIYEENLDLVDGMRVITRIGSNFYPGFVRAIEAPYIFAVHVDGERGNKPHIYAAEELLEKSLLEVKPHSKKYIPPGTRVCALWSSKLNFLYPGCVKAFSSHEDYVVVELDDGDEREVHVDNVRLIPKKYPKVTSTCKGSPIGEVDVPTMTRLPVRDLSTDKSPTRLKLNSDTNNFDDKEQVNNNRNMQFGKYEAAGKKIVAKSKNFAEFKLKKERDRKENETKLGFGKSIPENTSDNHDKIKSDIKVKSELKDATLTAEILKDGLRILTKRDGHFYPGRLNAIRPPDIYGVLLDNERGFRPMICAREEVLNDSIREIKIKHADIPMGTRISAYWSAKYHFLHPGTIIPVTDEVDRYPGKYLNVELDDGDVREIHIDQMRLLPKDYPKMYKEVTPSPRKKSSSRPSSRASEGPNTSSKSEHSRPGSSQSNHSDTDAYKGKTTREPSKEPPAETQKTPVLTSDSKFLTSNSPFISSKIQQKPPVHYQDRKLTSSPGPKISSKIHIPEPATNLGPVDLVGLISKGIDKLVDKKVQGNRLAPANQINRTGDKPPFTNSIGKPPPPFTPNPFVAPQQFTPPRPTVQTIQIKTTNQDTPVDKEKAQQSPAQTEEPGNKAKSRLSSLIEAMSGKMKKPESILDESLDKNITEQGSPLKITPPSSPLGPPSNQVNLPPNPAANKWLSAFNVKSSAESPTLKGHNTNDTDIPSHHNNQSSLNPTIVQKPRKGENQLEDGYLNSKYLVVGVNILLLKDSCFHPAIVKGIGQDNKYGVAIRNSRHGDITHYTEQDLILNSVMEREAKFFNFLVKDMRVAVYLNNQYDSLYTGTVAHQKDANTLLISMDGGGAYQEVILEYIRVLPNNYPKIYPSESKTETTNLNGYPRKDFHLNDPSPKIRHKHNILLGYDFVDENDSDIQAWESAINRKKKTDKNKAVLCNPEVKQEVVVKPEVEEIIETSSQSQDDKTKSIQEETALQSDVKNTMNTMLTSITAEERMRISLLSNVLKKHSPKKDILKRHPPGCKSPRVSQEFAKKEKKKKEKEPVTKKLILEENKPTDTDVQETVVEITSELLSLCQESNIEMNVIEEETRVDDHEDIKANITSSNSEHLKESDERETLGNIDSTVPTHSTIEDECEATKKSDNFDHSTQSHSATEKECVKSEISEDLDNLTDSHTKMIVGECVTSEYVEAVDATLPVQIAVAEEFEQIKALEDVENVTINQSTIVEKYEETEASEDDGLYKKDNVLKWDLLEEYNLPDNKVNSYANENTSSIICDELETEKIDMSEKDEEIVEEPKTNYEEEDLNPKKMDNLVVPLNKDDIEIPNLSTDKVNERTPIQSTDEEVAENTTDIISQPIVSNLEDQEQFEVCNSTNTELSERISNLQESSMLVNDVSNTEKTQNDTMYQEKEEFKEISLESIDMKESIPMEPNTEFTEKCEIEEKLDSSETVPQTNLEEEINEISKIIQTETAKQTDKVETWGTQGNPSDINHVLDKADSEKEDEVKSNTIIANEILEKSDGSDALETLTIKKPLNTDLENEEPTIQDVLINENIEKTIQDLIKPVEGDVISNPETHRTLSEREVMNDDMLEAKPVLKEDNTAGVKSEEDGCFEKVMDNTEKENSNVENETNIQNDIVDIVVSDSRISEEPIDATKQESIAEKGYSENTDPNKSEEPIDATKQEYIAEKDYSENTDANDLKNINFVENQTNIIDHQDFKFFEEETDILEDLIYEDKQELRAEMNNSDSLEDSTNVSVSQIIDRLDSMDDEGLIESNTPSDVQSNLLGNDLFEESFDLTEKEVVLKEEITTSTPKQKSRKKSDQNIPTIAKDSPLIPNKINVEIPQVEKDTETSDTDLRKGKIENGFVYIDSKLPLNWYIKVKRRTGGKSNEGGNGGKGETKVMTDSYFFTPCFTKLRSTTEIIKFLEGTLPSKPQKNEPIIPLKEMPLRVGLSKEDYGCTRDIDPKIFDLSKTPCSSTQDALKEDTKKDSSSGNCLAKEEVGLIVPGVEIGKLKKGVVKIEKINSTMISKKKKKEEVGSKVPEVEIGQLKKGVVKIEKINPTLIGKKKEIKSKMVISSPTKKKKISQNIISKNKAIKSQNLKMKKDKMKEKNTVQKKIQNQNLKSSKEKDTKKKIAPIFNIKKKVIETQNKKTKKGIDKNVCPSDLKTVKVTEAKKSISKDKVKQKSNLQPPNSKVVKTIDSDEVVKEDEHVFKIPSLESFISQKNKNTKLLSPPLKSNEKEKEEETVVLENKISAQKNDLDDEKNESKIEVSPHKDDNDNKADIKVEIQKKNDIGLFDLLLESTKSNKKTNEGDNSEDLGETNVSDGDVDEEKNEVGDVEDSENSQQFTDTISPCKSDESSDDDSSPSRVKIVATKRKTRSSSLSGSESDEDKNPSKKLNREKDTSETSSPKDHELLSPISRSDSDSEEGKKIRRKTRSERKRINTRSKESGSDKENDANLKSGTNDQENVIMRSMEDVAEHDINNESQKMVVEDEPKVNQIKLKSLPSEKGNNVESRKTRGSEKKKTEKNDEDIKQLNKLDKDATENETRATRSRKSLDSPNSGMSIESPKIENPIKEKKGKESPTVAVPAKGCDKTVSKVENVTERPSGQLPKKNDDLMPIKNKTIIKTEKNILLIKPKDPLISSEGKSSKDENMNRRSRGRPSTSEDNINSSNAKKPLKEEMLSKKIKGKQVTEITNAKEEIDHKKSNRRSSNSKELPSKKENTKEKSVDKRFINKESKTSNKCKVDKKPIIEISTKNKIKDQKRKIEEHITPSKTDLKQSKEDDVPKKPRGRPPKVMEEKVTENDKNELKKTKAQKRKLSNDSIPLESIVKKVAVEKIDEPKKSNSTSEKDDSNNDIKLGERKANKKKLLGPKSRRKFADNYENDDEETGEKNAHAHKSLAKEANLTQVNEIECVLLPTSPQKQYNNTGEAKGEENKSDKEREETGNKKEGNDDKKEDGAKEGDSKEGKVNIPPHVPASIYSSIEALKHSKFDLKLVSLFKHQLQQVECAHCKAVGQSVLENVHVDTEEKVISLECQACNWTTIRRVSINTRDV